MKTIEKNIFVVEDDRDISELMKIILESEGYKVKNIYDAKNLLSIVSKEKPDLIIMDLHIEASDGAELVRKFKQSEKTKTIPVVLVSAKNALEEIAENAGADGFLSKPFDINDLTKLVNKLI